MALQLVGTLPVSSVNLGLAFGPSGLAAQVAALQAEITKLTAALDLQVMVALKPPDPTTLLALQGCLDATALAAAFAIWPTLTADANAELTAELGVVLAQIEFVGDIVTTLEAGANSGGLTGWTYAGRARGFGSTLAATTQYGFGAAAPDDEVNALIIACPEFGAWASFSASFNTGTTATADLGPATTQEQLQCLGTLTGGQWDTGALTLAARFRLYLDLLYGRKTQLEAQLQVSLGIGLPDIDALLAFGATLDLDLALDNLVTVKTDLLAAISGLQARIDLLLDLLASLDAQLSASGLTVWTYSGRAGDLGAALAAEIQDGLPGGTGPAQPVYGVAIACASPSAWAAFGNICVI
jgi:hypothetical protein